MNGDSVWVLPRVEGFHNFWATILYSSGIVGLALVVIVYLSIISRALKATSDPKLRIILLSFLLSYAVLLWYRWTATSGILEFAVFSYILCDIQKQNRGETVSLEPHIHLTD